MPSVVHLNAGSLYDKPPAGHGILAATRRFVIGDVNGFAKPYG